MKTDELIKVLSTNVEPVDRWQVVRDIVAAIAIGTIAYFAWMGMLI